MALAGAGINRIPAGRPLRSSRSVWLHETMTANAFHQLTQSAMSRHWPPDADSRRPAEAVCSVPICHMGRIIPLCRRLLLFPPFLPCA